MPAKDVEKDPYEDYLAVQKLDYYPYCYHWIFCSFIICLVIHHVFSPLLFRKYNRAYREFPRDKRMEWDSRTVSTIHATVVSILCLLTLLTDSLIWKHPVTYPSRTGLVALSISIGYFLCDMVSMPIYWSGSNLYTFLLHHAVATYAFFLVIQYRMCTFFGVYRLTTELSTPFINQRWFYRTIGYKPDRRRVCTVTLMFAILFAITRNFMSIPYWWITYRIFGSPGHLSTLQALPWVNRTFVFPPLILDLLNLYWARKTYRIGWRAAKCLWSVDWRNDIRLAHARLRRRLRRIRRRTLSDSAKHPVHSPPVDASPTDKTEPLTSDLSCNQFMMESSSSNYSSETEYEPVDSDTDTIAPNPDGGSLTTDFNPPTDLGLDKDQEVIHRVQ